MPARITKDMLAVPASHKTWRWAGWLKCGYPIVAIDASIWYPSRYSLDTYIMYVMYAIEHAMKVWCGPGVNRGVLIFELEFNFEGMKPSATRCLLALSTLLQEVYVERFAGFFLCNCNRLFRVTWSWLKGLVSPRVAPLVHFVPPERN